MLIAEIEEEQCPGVGGGVLVSASVRLKSQMVAISTDELPLIRERAVAALTRTVYGEALEALGRMRRFIEPLGPTLGMQLWKAAEAIEATLSVAFGEEDTEGKQESETPGDIHDNPLVLDRSGRHEGSR